MTKRGLIRRLGALALALLLEASAAAPPVRAESAYPKQTITFIVAFAAGGIADNIARIVAQKLTERFGQNVVVENRGGAGGNLAAKAVAAADPDGYTVLITTTAIAINETLYRKKGYETEDLTPVALAASTPEVLAVNPANPARTLREFIVDAKWKPVTFGTAGVGTGSYVAARYFFQMIGGIEAVHVPFPGGAPAINAALGNHIDVLAASLPPLIPQIERGALRGLGVAAPTRQPTISNVPTYAEAGFPDFTAASWVGFFVPATTDREVMLRLNTAIEDTLHERDVAERLKQLGMEPMFHSEREAGALFKKEIETWAKMVRALGLITD